MEITLQLDDSKLSRLLGLAVGTPVQEVDLSDPEQAAGLLQDRLAGALPIRLELLEKIPMILGRLEQEILPEEERPVQEILLDESSSLATLKRVKNYGKKLARRQIESGSTDDIVAVAIYYAAIASALVHHQQRITSYDGSYLGRSFSFLAEKSWMSPELTCLFHRAAGACQRQGVD